MQPYALSPTYRLSVWMVCLVGILLLGAGCSRLLWTGGEAILADPLEQPRRDRVAAATPHRSEPVKESPVQSAAHSEPVEESEEELENRIFSAPAEPGQPHRVDWGVLREPGPDGFRYFHEGLQRELAAAESPPSVIQVLAKSDSREVRAAAVILTARLEPAEHLEELYQVVDDRTLGLSSRLAALETLAHGPAELVAPKIDTLYEKYTAAQIPIPGQGDARMPNPLYNEPIHQELLRTTDRLEGGVPTGPRLQAALAAGGTIRDEAIRLWLAAHPEGPVPPMLAELLTDADPNTRCRALGLWAADRKEPLPETVIRLLNDTNESVRQAALRAAVAHRHPEAINAVCDMAAEFDLGTKLSAIRMLGQIGDEPARQALRKIAAGEKERVREEVVVAQAVAGDWDAIYETLGDDQWSVRRAVADVLAEQSDQRAVRAARQLLNDASSEVRGRMVQSLGRWPFDRSGPLLLESLANEDYRVRSGAAEILSAAWPPATAFPFRSGADRREAALKDLHRQWIEQFGGEGLAALEQLTHEEERLRLDDVSRRKIQEIVDQGFVPTRIDSIEVSRWQKLLDAARDDKAPETHEFARMGLRHPSALIRRLACEYLGRRADTADATEVLPLLEDRDPTVVAAAVETLGRLKNPRACDPLAKLLASYDKPLRVQAAESLVQLGDDRGEAALERLTYDDDSTIRRQTTQAMSRLQRPVFISSLVRLLDDPEYTVVKAALEGLTVTVDNPPAEPRRMAALPHETQIAKWRRWYDESFDDAPAMPKSQPPETPTGWTSRGAGD